MKKNCTQCKYFESWNSVFDGDYFEPTEYGRCLNDKQDEDENFGIDFVCDLFEPKTVST